jgi:hypothetical protein
MSTRRARHSEQHIAIVPADYLSARADNTSTVPAPHKHAVIRRCPLCGRIGAVDPAILVCPYDRSTDASA